MKNKSKFKKIKEKKKYRHKCTGAVVLSLSAGDYRPRYLDNSK